MKIKKAYILLAAALFTTGIFAQGYEVEEEHTNEQEVTLDWLKNRQKKKPKPKPFVGDIAIKLNLGGYDFNSYYNSMTSDQQRRYSLPFPYMMLGWEVAVRMGKDQDKFYQSEGAGFSYYRSNKGFFIDMEIGGRFYCGPGNSGESWECEPPQFYSFQSTTGGVADRERTVTLSALDFDPTTNSITSITQTDNEENANLDDVDGNRVALSGNKGSKVTVFYFNNFFHFTALNWLFNFGSTFNLVDVSIGPSLRVARYSDYGDPERMRNRSDDSTIANIDLAMRIYLHVPFTNDRVRLRAHLYYPFYSHIARALKDKNHNNEEYIINSGVDIALLKYLYLGLGYEWHYWKINPLSSRRLNLTRPDFEHNRRIGHYIYGELVVHVPFGPRKN